MIEARAGRFYDAAGRQLILHGLNCVNKDPKAGYLFHDTDSLFADFRRWGFNCVRLGVMWDGLEPRPGAYDETYLRGIGRILDRARERELFVFLDMHQDLYSALYADGAPAWATLHEDRPHIVGEVWSDAYMASPAVQAALDNFWRNAPVPGEKGGGAGAGLQDHLIACWKLLAERFGNHPAVIGYDLYNEPMMGRAAPRALSLQFARGAELLAGGDGATGASDPAEAMLALWGSAEGRSEVLRSLDDRRVYAEVMEAPRPAYNEFEREALMPFYRRAAAAIRSVDAGRIIFLEASMGSNMGVYSAIERLEGGGPQAYAPHGYDLVVDTPDVASASSARVEVIFSRHGETARRLGMPMLVGEWGAYGDWPATLPAADSVARIFERLLCSDTYWEYAPGLEEAACFRALSRPYPERVAGTLEAYSYDPVGKRFECSWTESPGVEEPTIIYLPGWFGFDQRRLGLDAGSAYHVEELGSGAVRLRIAPTGRSLARSVSATGSAAIGDDGQGGTR
jgi:endoglycosylceramidase